MIWADLVANCAPNVAQITLERLIDCESSGNPFALNVNKLTGPPPRPASATAAVETARHYIRLGYSVDMGLMQINSRNLPTYGYADGPTEAVFDVCQNLSLGAAILQKAYTKARSIGHPSGQTALKVAFSIYNTGNESAGFANGYVSRCYYAVRDLWVLNKTHSESMLSSGRPLPPTRAASKPYNVYAADPQVGWSD